VDSFSLAGFIWSVADLLRGDYKQSEYGRVILPFTVLRRLDCVLEPTKAAVLAEAKVRENFNAPIEQFLIRKSKVSFYNTSQYDFQRLLGDPDNIKANLNEYINSFSENTRDIFLKYDFLQQIERLDAANLLFQIVKKFAGFDLHPERVDNGDMGVIFEELIRRFAELSNETAGEHYTPREVIRLMVNILFAADDDALTKPGVVRSVYDPAAGTGGMLSIASEHLRHHNPEAKLIPFGQELNPESYAICKADMLIRGENIANIAMGNTLSHDGNAGKRFDYMLSNPPFGVEWKKVEAAVRREAENLGYDGRFGAGLPRVSDGSLLFLQHLLSKMRPAEAGGSRIAIVLNGSPLFTGGAGSGESNIRQWIVENDWLEAIIALPPDMFYNTGISTYIWLLTNRKAPERSGKIQLINAVGFFEKMRRSLGSKRKQLSDDHIDAITRLYGAFEDNEYSKIFDNDDFGYHTITVERPLRLNFAVAPERLSRLDKLASFKPDTVTAIKEALTALDADHVYKNREMFTKDVGAALRKAELKLSAPQLKALISAFGEHDDTADICRDSKGRQEPDPSLRDSENVPLKEEIEVYFKREVLPYISDAWIDHSKTKIGYEIPFTRHFYVYQPPRQLEEIDASLLEVTRQIQRLLSQVIE
jgi:type I restriction enzyme M protein